jgi:hypothetical protein
MKSGQPIGSKLFPTVGNSKDFREVFLTTVVEWGATAEPILNNPHAMIDVLSDTKTFALFWFSQEMRARNVDLSAMTTNEEQAQQLFFRLCTWTRYRALMHHFLLLKECPKAASENPVVASAAFASLLFHQDPGNPRLAEFLQRCSKDTGLHETFLHESRMKQSAQWKFPILSAWLFSVWPIVEGYGWSNREVWITAGKKFEENDNWRPLGTADAMADLCKSLGLHAPGNKAGAPSHHDDTEEDPLPEMGELALRIPAEIPDNSAFHE